MKHLSDGVCSVLLICFITCCAVQPPDSVIDSGLGFTDVVYSNGGRTLTIYLEGGAPETKESRALSSGMAQMSHDFYEVVFEYEGYAARASWELGQAVGISGVYRTDAGVDYSTVNAGAPAGKAVLFAGTKADKTLLGIGRLVAADGESGALITTSTRSITFEVAALSAGVDSGFTISHGNADFVLLEDTDNTVSKEFPVFVLPLDQEITAVYTIDVNADISDYINAVKIREPGKVILNEETGFRHNGKRWLVEDEFLYDYASLSVSMINNDTDNEVFNNEIEFTIDELDDQGKVFSFSFEVPVYAINYSENSNNGIPKSIDWFIRPGFVPFCYDLDDGNKEYGGSVLLSAAGISNSITVSLE